MAEQNTPNGLPKEIIEKLLDLAGQQNNKLTFDDITTMATSHPNFTQSDFAVVMSFIKAKNIEPSVQVRVSVVTPLLCRKQE